MVEEFPFTPKAVDGDEIGSEKSLRPKTLREFIGQERVTDNLRLAIEAALTRGEVLDHVLFSGMPGLGKTTLAHLVASTMGVELRPASGPSLERGKDVVGLLTNLKRGDVLFIDEIHRMSAQAEEYLYSAMEDLCVDVMVDRGPDARTYRLPVEPFTLVGATTREGLLTAPLRSRFGIVEKLEPYLPESLVQILHRSAYLLGCRLDKEAAEFLAARCRGTPRYANRFLRRIRDVAQTRSGWKGEGSLAIGMDAVREGLERLGIDDNGLDRVDRRILEVLLDHGRHAVGIKTLAVSVGEAERTIEDVYEPYLIRKGLLVKTPRGRRATARAASRYCASRGTGQGGRTSLDSLLE